MLLYCICLKCWTLQKTSQGEYVVKNSTLLKYVVRSPALKNCNFSSFYKLRACLNKRGSIAKVIYNDLHMSVTTTDLKKNNVFNCYHARTKIIGSVFTTIFLHQQTSKMPHGYVKVIICLFT